jgi:HEAT repeat protein
VLTSNLMRQKVAALALTLVVALVGLASGCSPGAKTPKVDLQAQLQTLKGTDKDARMNAFATLGTLGEAAAPALPDLLTYLKDPDSEIRRLSLYVIMQIGPKAKSASPQVQALLEDSNTATAMQAGITLRTIDPDAAQGLAAKQGAPGR